MLFNWIVLFHLIGLVLWVGGLLAVTQVLILHSQEASPETRRRWGVWRRACSIAWRIPVPRWC